MTVQTGPSFELQKAIVAILLADDDVQTLLGSSPRIYEDAPGKPTFPYVTIGEGQRTPDLAECIDGSELFPVLHIWSRTSSWQEAKSISATIWQALRTSHLIMTGHVCKIFEPDELGDQELRDPDGMTRHIASHYRALTEPSDGYVGPLDMVPGAILAYGQRALSASTLGYPLYTIQRTVDDAQQTFNSNPITGDAPISDIIDFIGSDSFQQTGNVAGSQFIDLVDPTGVKPGQIITGADILNRTLVCATGQNAGIGIIISEAATGTNPAEVLTFTQGGVVALWHDQSGTGADGIGAQSADTLQGALVTDEQNGRPSIRNFSNFTASSFSAVANGGVFTVIAAAPYGWSIEADDSNTSGSVIAKATSGGPSAHCQCFASNQGNDTGGEKDLTQDNTIRIFEFVWQYGSKTFLLNGESQGFDTDLDITGNPANMTLDTFSTFLAASVGAGDVPRGGFEFYLWPYAVSPSDRAALRKNISAYYGITVS